VDLTKGLLSHQSYIRGCIRALAVDWVCPKISAFEEEDRSSLSPCRTQSGASLLGKRASLMSHSPSAGMQRSPSLGSRKSVVSIAKVPILQSSRVSRALSGSDDGRLVLWDLTDNRVEKIYEFQFHLISAMAVEWSRLRALIGHGYASLDLYDLEDSCWLRSFSGHTCLVTAIHVSWNKSLALCGSGDGALYMWEIRKATHVQALKGHSGGISAATVHWKSMRAVTGASDHSVRLWNLKHGSCTRVFSVHDHPICALSVDWSTGIATTASANGVGALLLWGLGDTVEQPKVLELQHGDQKASTSVLRLQVRPKSHVVVETETT